jgi:hypothetical protein
MPTAQPQSVPPAATSPALTIDTPLLQLIDDPRTRPVLEKHLGELVRHMLESEETARFFGESTPRDLTLDPHVRGFTVERLQRLEKDLLAAQSPAQTD